MIPITTIIIAEDEEKNIRHCLQSIQGWAVESYVVDSHSADRTALWAAEEGANIVSHKFSDWASQRNWALDNLTLQSEWVLFLDADEQVTGEFKEEVDQALDQAVSDLSAFYVHFDFIFLGRCLRHAYESPPVIRLIRRGKARWQGEGAREYCIVDGRIGEIQSRIRHEDHKGLSAWIDKQNRNADREAHLLWQQATTDEKVNRIDHSSERRLRIWVRNRIWSRLPLYVRPFLYFLYRYLWCGGFLDGSGGLAYTFLQGFWFNFLIDAKYYELAQRPKLGHDDGRTGTR